MKKIHVVGDSHVMLFTGHPLPYLLVPSSDYKPDPHDLKEKFSTYFCVLLRAYHIIPDTTNLQAAHFFRLIKTLPKGSTVIVVAGEIDCRGPIINCILKNGSIEEEVAKCTNRYLTGIEYIKNIGYNPIILAPYPHQFTDKKEDGVFMGLPKDLPVEEWCTQKEIIVDLFENILRMSNFPIISINDWIFENEITRKREYWADLIHLSEKVWPIVEDIMIEQGII